MKASTKSLATALAATMLATSFVAAPTAASAKPFHGKHWGGHHHHGGHWGHHRRHWGPGLIGVGLGLGALGAVAASNAYAAECYVVRRRAVDDYGNLYVRNVRVCE